MRRILLLAALAIPAQAGLSAAPPPHSAAAEVAALFAGGCVPNTGFPARLRDWAAGRRLKPLPQAEAAVLLGQQAGRVYRIRARDAFMVLVSYDTGDCRVTAVAADFDATVIGLSADLRKVGVKVAPLGANVPPDHKSELLQLDARLGQRHWTITASMLVHEDAPTYQPQVNLLATGG